MYYYLIRILSAVDKNASTEEKLKQIEEMINLEKRNEMAESTMRNLINSMNTETKSGILLFPKDMNWDDISKKETASLIRSIAVCSELDKLADDINKLPYPRRRKAANYCYKLDIGSDTEEITIGKNQNGEKQDVTIS